MSIVKLYSITTINISIKLLICILIILLPMVSFSNASNNISGKVITLRVEGAGNFYYLKDRKGREIFLCGVWEPAEDSSKQWISAAEESGETVTVNGKIIKDGDGFAFENGQYSLVSSNRSDASSTKINIPIANHLILCPIIGKVGPITVGQFFDAIKRGQQANGVIINYRWEQINSNLYKVVLTATNQMSGRNSEEIFGFTTENNIAIMTYFSNGKNEVQGNNTARICGQMLSNIIYGIK